MSIYGRGSDITRGTGSLAGTLAWVASRKNTAVNRRVHGNRSSKKKNRSRLPTYVNSMTTVVPCRGGIHTPYIYVLFQDQSNEFAVRAQVWIGERLTQSVLPFSLLLTRTFQSPSLNELSSCSQAGTSTSFHFIFLGFSRLLDK